MGRRKPGKYATEKSVQFRRELASLRFLLGLLCHAIIYCSWHRVQMRLFRTTEKKMPRWDETQLQRATLFFVHYAFFFWVKNIIHLRTLWKCIVLRKVYGGKGIKIVFFFSSVRTFLLLTVADQLSKEKKISALCTRSLMRSFVAIR